jgi:hypothetical protein
MAGICEHGDELCGSIKIDQMSDYRHFNKDLLHHGIG